MRLGDLIRAARERAGLSLQELSDATDIQKSHLHGIEHGKTINIGLLSAVRLSIALGVPVNSMAAAAMGDSSHG